MTRLTTFLLALVVVCAGVQAPRAQAQLILVTGNYRVVELDHSNHRVGVALPEAKPDHTQNWVYLDLDTEIVRRQSNGDGWFKDERLSDDGFFGSVKPGDMMKIHGGRRWDGSITARKIWM